MIRVKARFDGHLLIPEQPLDLPVDCIVEFEIEPPPASAGKSARAAVNKAVAAAERADQITRVLPRPDKPVQSSVAKHSSDEVSGSRDQ